MDFIYIAAALVAINFDATKETIRYCRTACKTTFFSKQ